MNLLLASNNAHKHGEISSILADLGVSLTLYRPRDLGFDFDCHETGTTFAANAAAKAFGLFDLTRGTVRDDITTPDDPQRIAAFMEERFGGPIPVLADDSGVCVTALNGAPGVYSARFGNRPDAPPLTDTQRNELLLETIKHADDRSAYYVCNTIIVEHQDRYVTAQATWWGRIADQPLPGETGFGYDPIFWMDDYQTSVARIPQAQKDRISHRAQAVRAVLAAHQRLGQGQMEHYR